MTHHERIALLLAYSASQAATGAAPMVAHLIASTMVLCARAALGRIELAHYDVSREYRWVRRALLDGLNEIGESP